MEKRNSNILKICHIADIHIRSTQRHDEYRRVFNNLRKDIEARKVDVVWIGGDTFHTKVSGISPEYINLLHDTLRSLREVAEVHLMLGNHDGNLKNLERMDAVSPIINIMDDSRVKLYKTSGVYPLNSKVNWCVYSPFDPELWDEVQPEPGKYNIACFHGAVAGSKTASDWELEGEKNVSDFDGFDIALLGDIHKMQFLGGYNPPRIAYPGSLIQQSYDEDLDHGYLLWTIDLDSKKREVEFVKIEGANPFITLRVNEENYKTVVESSLADLKNVRCRLVCEDLTTVQKNSLKETLSSYDAHEVVMLDNQKSEKSVKKQIAEAVKLDSVESLVRQAKHYAEHNIKTPASWETIEKEIRIYADKLKVGTTKPHRWTLKEFEFDNLYSYAEDNRINFSDYEGLIGIIGPNASGKSSVLGALLYGLFNSSDRDCSKNAFYINDAKDSSRTRSEIDVDGVVYDILRTSTRSPTNRDASATKLQLKSKTANLTGEQRNDTDKVIKELIGSVEDFMMTSMAVQEDLGKFLKEGSTARKEIVSRFLGIDCLSDIHNLAKKEMNLLKSERKSFGTSTIQMMSEEISKKDSLLSELVNQVEKNILFREELSKKLQKLELEIAKSGSSIVDRVSLQRDIDKMVLLKNRIQEQTDQLEAKREEISVQISDLDSKIASIDALEIAKKLKDAMKVKDSLSSAKNEFSISSEKFRAAERSSLKLLEVPCGDQFPTCKFITDSHKDKASLNALTEKMKEIEEIVSDLSDKMSELKIDDLLSKSKTRDELARKRENFVRELSESEVACSSNKENLMRLEEKLQYSKDQLATSSGDDTIGNKLKDLRTSHAKVQSDLDSQHSEMGSLKKDIEVSRKQMEACLAIESRMDLLEAVVEIFSKDGLPRFIMSQHLDHINTRMNDLLSKVVDFTVELRMDDEKGNLEVILKKRGKKRVAELGSGMERTLVSLALRVALRDISCIPMPDFFVVDEGFSMLDADNIMACKNLLLELKKIFRFVIVMTHNDTIKEMMDKTIEVTMPGEFSKLDAKVA